MNDFSTLVDTLAPRGLRVLPQSHLVPVDVWLDSEGSPGSPGSLVHLTGRGTRLRLRTYSASDLTTLEVRSECDCRSHRDAGAAARVVLRPGALPTAEAVYDGAALHGWTGVEAARLGVADLPAVLEVLLEGLLGPVATPLEPALAV